VGILCKIACATEVCRLQDNLAQRKRTASCLLPRSKTPKLPKERQALLANSAGGLQSQGTKAESGTNKASVVLLVLPQTVVVGGRLRVEVLGRERRRDADVNGQAFRLLPARKRDVPRTTPRPLRVPQDAPLLQNRRQETLVTHLGYQVPNAVVAHDDVSILFAARGVVAVQVKRLRAKRTTNIRACHINPQTVPRYERQRGP
jgi:hypothetical protein